MSKSMKNKGKSFTGKRPHSASIEQGNVEKRHKITNTNNRDNGKPSKMQLDGHTILKTNYRFKVVSYCFISLLLTL